MIQRVTETGTGSSGYTLLEVMVALLIVAMSLGAVFQNLSQSKRSAIRSETALKAVRLSHNLFNDTVLINDLFRQEIIQGEIPGEKNWHYQMTLSPLVLQIDDPKKTGRILEPVEIESMKKATLCVTYGPGDHARSFCFDKWFRL